MGDHKDMIRFLELLPQPGLCVAGGMIVAVNQAARQLLIQPDREIAPLLGADLADYESFTEGTLYLSVHLESHALTATVTRMDECDIFTLESGPDTPELKALALAAAQLRTPLADLSTVLHLSGVKDSEVERRLYQLHRTVCNMSDAARYADARLPRPVCADVCALLTEQLSKVQALLEQTQIGLDWSCPTEPVMTLVDEELLERAVHNMLSNALKASRPGDRVQVRLTRRGTRLYLSVRDHGPGIPEQALGTVFTRFRRQPGLEGAADGLGLGLSLTCAAATAHGGTVLIQSPKEGGTLITMSISIRQHDGTQLRSPILRIDYAGERDHALLELSDTLPAQTYEKY